MNWESQDTPHGDPGPVRVLLVEDDPGDARRIESLLRDSGDAEISLRTATSTAEAVEQLESDSVQVVLLDLGLPDGHGTETLDRILPVTGTAAVVVMTDIEDRELAEAALERGAQDFLVKGRHDAAMLVRSIRFAARRRARLVDIERLAAESRQHLSEMQSILDGSPLPMVLIDEARRVKLVNHAARDMVDTARVPGSTHLGQALGCLLCLDDPESCGNWPACASCALRTTVADTFDTGRPHRDVEAELRLAGPSSRESAWFRIATSRVTPSDEPMVLLSLEDITSQRRASDRRRTLNRLLNTMLEIDELIVRESDRDSLLDGACRVLVESGDFPAAWFAVEGTGGRLRVPASHGVESEWLRSLESELDRRGGTGCAALEAIRGGSTVRIDDVSTDPRSAAWREALMEHGIASGLSTPVSVAGTVIGALTLCGAESGQFEPEVVKLVERLAASLGFALAGLDQEQARRDAEADLRTSETRYRMLFERNPAGVYRTTVDGRFLAANPALVEMLRFADEDQLLRVPVATIYHTGEDRETFLERLLADGVVENFEVELRRRDGTSAWALLNASLIEVEDGVMFIEGTAIDITRRRQIEEQLLQAQRLEAVGRLAAGVAHDFNNLLQAVSTQVRTLGALRDDVTAFDGRVGEIEDLVRRGAQMTRQLLIFSRRETSRPEILDLSDVALTAATLLQRLLREDVLLEMDTTSDGLPIRADRGELEQVVLNLALNAQDAMPAGGTLVVRTRANGGRAVLGVEDSGRGIPEAILDRVFEPFFTTKPASTGTGLGLSVVRGIIERAGGSIELDSRVGGGTRVVVTLPVAEVPAAARDAIEPSGDDSHDGLVLLVEDEDGVREGLAEALRTVGYRVRTAADVATARRALADDTFDAVLSDMVLPDGSGVELLRTVRSDHPDRGCILMSGYAADVLEAEGLGTGADTVFLQKPFGLTRLIDALHQVMARRNL